MTQRAPWSIVARALPVAIVLGLCLLAFGAGVDLSERPGMPDASLATRVYYALGLFLLGGLDLGVPTGGPAWARTTLWASYFMAPLITTTAVAEGLLRLANPTGYARLRPRDHVILVGAGRLGLLYLDAVRRTDPERRVIAVDMDPSASAVDQIAAAGAQLIRADIDRHATLMRLGLDQAHGVVLATDVDLMNLGAAFEMVRLNPGLVVAAHVADIGLRRTTGDLAERARVQLFNTHEVTAAHVFDAKLANHLRHTEARDVVVVAGFGRFGQTLLRHLHLHAPGEVEKVLIVDHDAERRARAYADQVGFDPACAWQGLDADLLDPDTWAHVARILQEHDVVPVVILATNDDATNVQAAIGLRRRLPRARLFVRTFATSSFVRDLEERYELEGLTLDGVLGQALARHYLDAFGTVGTRRNWWT